VIINKPQTIEEPGPAQAGLLFKIKKSTMKNTILAASASLAVFLFIACYTNTEWLVWLSVLIFGVLIFNELDQRKKNDITGPFNFFINQSLIKTKQMKL